jgi:hypothetical protein
METTCSPLQALHKALPGTVSVVVQTAARPTGFTFVGLAEVNEVFVFHGDGVICGLSLQVNIKNAKDYGLESIHDFTERTFSINA